MFTTVQLQHPLVAPDGAQLPTHRGRDRGILSIIAATFPLLRRITGPEVARNE
jgi:hypothetical protein